MKRLKVRQCCSYTEQFINEFIITYQNALKRRPKLALSKFMKTSSFNEVPLKSAKNWLQAKGIEWYGRSNLDEKSVFCLLISSLVVW